MADSADSDWAKPRAALARHLPRFFKYAVEGADPNAQPPYAQGASWRSSPPSRTA